MHDVIKRRCVAGAGIWLAMAGTTAAAQASGAAARPATSEAPAAAAGVPRAWQVAYWAQSAAVYLGSITAPAKRDAWAVGATGRPGRGERPLVLRWDGRRWATYSVPGLSPDYIPVTVTATSPDNVWIFADRRAGAGPYDEEFRWDGTHWTVLPAPPSGGGGLQQVLVLGPSDAWDVGPGTACTASDCSTVWHWNGVTWTPTQVGTSVEDLAGAGRHVWLVGRRDVAHVYVRPAIYRWTGTTWQFFDGPYRRLTVDPTIAASPRGDLWMQSMPDRHHGHVILYHWNGSAWSATVPPSRLSGQPMELDSWLTFDGHDGVWSGATAHWDGRRWINAARVDVVPTEPAGMNVFVAPVPGTRSTWGIGNGWRCSRSRSRCDRDFIAFFGGKP